MKFINSLFNQVSLIIFKIFHLLLFYKTILFSVCRSGNFELAHFLIDLNIYDLDDEDVSFFGDFYNVSLTTF